MRNAGVPAFLFTWERERALERERAFRRRGYLR
jgi:hypothetical protein